MGTPRIDVNTGDKYGRLTVVEVIKQDSPRKIRMLCSCGKQTDVWLSNLTSGHTKSCGCLSSETASKGNRTHGMSKTREYKSWQEMCYRVTNPNYEYYDKYSSLGIYEPWLNSFEDFYSHIGQRPNNDQRWSVGRIDNTVGYFPGNVRWEDGYQQNRNRGKTKANTSGFMGVSWRDDPNRPYGRAVATWYELDGTQRAKSFTEKHVGKEGAIAQAKEFRDAKILELVAQGAEYGEHHGS